MKSSRNSIVTESSGNIFADLGFRDPARDQIKAQLMLEIFRIIRKRGLTQTQAAEILGVRQPQVSGLMRGYSGAHSVERLMDFLAALGHDIEIRLKPTRKTHGEVSVRVA